MIPKNGKKQTNMSSASSGWIVISQSLHSPRTHVRFPHPLPPFTHAWALGVRILLVVEMACSKSRVAILQTFDKPHLEFLASKFFQKSSSFFFVVLRTVRGILLLCKCERIKRAPTHPSWVVNHQSRNCAWIARVTQRNNVLCFIANVFGANVFGLHLQCDINALCHCHQPNATGPHQRQLNLVRASWSPHSLSPTFSRHPHLIWISSHFVLNAPSLSHFFFFFFFFFSPVSFSFSFSFFFFFFFFFFFPCSSCPLRLSSSCFGWDKETQERASHNGQVVVTTCAYRNLLFK